MAYGWRYEHQNDVYNECMLLVVNKSQIIWFFCFILRVEFSIWTRLFFIRMNFPIDFLPLSQQHYNAISYLPSGFFSSVFYVFPKRKNNAHNAHVLCLTDKMSVAVQRETRKRKPARKEKFFST